jgi:hypothetical protein
MKLRAQPLTSPATERRPEVAKAWSSEFYVGLQIPSLRAAFRSLSTCIGRPIFWGQLPRNEPGSLVPRRRQEVGHRRERDTVEGRDEDGAIQTDFWRRRSGLSCGKTANRHTPPGHTRPNRSLEEFAYGCGKVEAVRTSRSPARLSTDQRNCADFDRRRGRRTSRLRDFGACWTRLPKCVPAHSWAEGQWIPRS